MSLPGYYSTRSTVQCEIKTCKGKNSALLKNIFVKIKLKKDPKKEHIGDIKKVNSFIELDVKIHEIHDNYFEQIYFPVLTLFTVKREECNR